MGRRQPQVPPAPAGSALAGEASTTTKGRGGATSKSKGSGGGAGVTGPGGGLLGTEAAERAFWELVFTRHERLRPLLGEARAGSAAHARRLARVHAARLFNDLVYAGLNPQEGVLGFHRTALLQAFLDGLVASPAAMSPAGVEAYVQQVRPDFAAYLNPPAAVTADAEYPLLGAGGTARSLDLHAGVCGDCFALTGGLPVQVPALKPDSDIGEVYGRIAELLPQAKLGDLVLRVHFRDREDALVEVIVGGQWLEAEGRYGWTCVPMARDTFVDPVLFDPTDRLHPPQLAAMGMFLPTTEVIMCTRGCLHSYAVGPLDGSAAAMMAPMAQDLLPAGLGAEEAAFLSAALGGLPPVAPAAPGTAPAKRGGGGDNGKRSSTGGAKKKTAVAAAASGSEEAAAAVASSTGTGTSTLMPATSSGLPFTDIEPGPVELAGGGKGGKGKPTKRYTCCAPGCQQSATFKPADEPRSKNNMVCVRHACKGMSCIKGPLCDHPDCVHEGISTVPRRATFGFPGERQRRCGKHKLAGMLYATELVKTANRDGDAPPPAKAARTASSSSAHSSGKSNNAPAAEGEMGDDAGLTLGGFDTLEVDVGPGALGQGAELQAPVQPAKGKPKAGGTKRRRSSAASSGSNSAAAGAAAAVASAAAAAAAASTATTSSASTGALAPESLLPPLPPLPSPATAAAQQDEVAAVSAAAFSSDLEAALLRGTGMAGLMGLGGAGAGGLTLGLGSADEEREQALPAGFGAGFAFGVEQDALRHLQLQQHQHQQTQATMASLLDPFGAGASAGATGTATAAAHAALAAAAQPSSQQQAFHLPSGVQYTQLPTTAVTGLGGGFGAQALQMDTGVGPAASLFADPSNAVASSSLLAALLGGKPAQQGGATAGLDLASQLFQFQQQQAAGPQQLQQQQLQQALQSLGVGGVGGGVSGDGGSQHPLRFDLLVDAAGKGGAADAAARKSDVEMAALAALGMGNLGGLGGAGVVGADPAAAWAELASPGAALLVEEAFGRLGPPTNTPGRSSSSSSSAAAAAAAAVSSVAPQQQPQQPQQRQPQQQQQPQQQVQFHPNASAASTMASVLGVAEDGQGATGGGFEDGGVVSMPSLLDSPDALHEQAEPEAADSEAAGEAGAPAGGSASVWAGEIAAVVVCLAGSSGVRGLEAEDEGIYFVKSVARWCPMALQGQGGDGQQRPVAAAGPKAGFLRELVRNADYLTPAADGRHLVSSLLPASGAGGAGGKQPGAAAVCLPAARGEAGLGLGRAAYRQEEAAGDGIDGSGVLCRGRGARRLVLGWSPSGLLEVDFDHRPCGTTISELEAAMVLRPILPQGPWLETFITDFARQGLALCAGDLMALLQGAVRVRRERAVAQGVRDALQVYDPEECLARDRDLPLDVLDGPLSSHNGSSSSSDGGIVHLLASHADPQGRPRFSPQAFVLLFNCFSATSSSTGTDPFAAARAVWRAVAAAAQQSGCDFRAFQPATDAALSAGAPVSPTRAGQRCFLRLADAEAPGRLVLDWYYSQADEDAAFGLASGGDNPSWGGVAALAGGAGRPKGVLLRWAGDGKGEFVWEAENARLQALLAAEAAGMGLDPASLSGLVCAAQKVSGDAAHPFMAALVEEGRRREHCRVIGGAC